MAYGTVRQPNEHEESIRSSTSEGSGDDGDADAQNLPLKRLSQANRNPQPHAHASQRNDEDNGAAEVEDDGGNAVRSKVQDSDEALAGVA